LDDESWSGPAKLEKRSRAIDKCDAFFIEKYASLGHNNQPINQGICQARNEFQLNWLHPHGIYSRHSNIQEKLLGNLKQKFVGYNGC
jgi:hypothetical protein